MTLRVLSIGPAVAVQDLGRPGYLSEGLTRGGAADRLAIYEGAALLGQDPALAVLEMMGLGGRFLAEIDTAIALTGAAMRCSIDGAPVAWNAAHGLSAGQILEIGPVTEGTYGYLHIAGGINVPLVMGARAAHMSVGLGAPLEAGDALPCVPAIKRADMILPRDARFAGGPLRVVPSMQTDLFSPELRKRLEATAFTRDPRADRQGMRLAFEGAPFSPEGNLSILSEIAVPGDVQIAGNGQPFILLCECQTTAGYPRIGTVLPCDLPRAAQCPPGHSLNLQFVDMTEARSIEMRARKDWHDLSKKVAPRVRSPEDIQNLRDYNLISGAITGG